MQKLVKLFKSRTFWTAFVTFLVAVLPEIQEVLGTLYEPVLAVLTFLVGYFKVNPSQDYE